MAVPQFILRMLPSEPKDRRRFLAHVVPFVVFMAFVQITLWMTLDNQYAHWWKRAPEQVMFPLQTLVVGGLLIYFWREYKFTPIRGIGLALVLGTLGIVCWLLPEYLYHRLGVADWGPGPRISIPLVIDTKEDGNWQLLGLAERLEGFDPTFIREAGHELLYWGAVFFRFLRMVVIVSLVEEIFWRGFLQRFLVNPDKPFHKTPFGTHTWKAYFLTTIFFTLVHNPVDWFACLIFGSIVYWISIRTKSLAACVAAHAIANLFLGLYTMYFQKWGFW